MIPWWLAAALVLVAAGAAQAREPLPFDLHRIPGLVDAGALAPRLLVRLTYSSRDNFLGRDVYGELERCYLQRTAARKLARAAALLRKRRPGLRLLVHDCVRPGRVQRAMWRLVKDTPKRRYVANPARGSMHSYGCAVDLTLADARGKPLDMGTPFDHAGARSQPRLERRLHLRGKLSAAQWANRLLLRAVMVRAGFIPLAIEWWHFDSAPARQVRSRYPRVP